jgi:hypothetical protein
VLVAFGLELRVLATVCLRGFPRELPLVRRVVQPARYAVVLLSVRRRLLARHWHCRLLRARSEWSCAAAPPSSVMNSRRLMSNMGLPPPTLCRSLPPSGR